jgi:hypothetical protein
VTFISSINSLPINIFKSMFVVFTKDTK